MSGDCGEVPDLWQAGYKPHETARPGAELFSALLFFFGLHYYIISCKNQMNKEQPEFCEHGRIRSVCEDCIQKQKELAEKISKMEFIEIPQKKMTRQEEKPHHPFEKEIYKEVGQNISEEERNAFKKLVLPYLWSKPKIEEFIEYSSKEIQADKSKVERRQKTAKETQTKEEKINYLRSKIAEGVLSHIIEQGEWLGDATRLTEASDYDDWQNGVDAVLEFEKERVAVIDFTIATSPTGIRKKWSNICDKIDALTLSEVKYFKSQIDGKKRRLTLLPGVFISLDYSNIKELTHLYLNKDHMELKNHWVKFAILEEIRTQSKEALTYINLRQSTLGPEATVFMTEKYKELKQISEEKISSLGEIKELRERAFNRDSGFSTTLNIVKGETF